jgi:hypothetical protein
LLGVFVFLPIVILGLVLTGVIEPTDISNLRMVVGGLGFLGRLVGKILTFLRKSCPKNSVKAKSNQYKILIAPVSLNHPI